MGEILFVIVTNVVSFISVRALHTKGDEENGKKTRWKWQMEATNRHIWLRRTFFKQLSEKSTQLLILSWCQCYEYQQYHGWPMSAQTDLSASRCFLLPEAEPFLIRCAGCRWQGGRRGHIEAKEQTALDDYQRINHLQAKTCLSPGNTRAQSKRRGQHSIVLSAERVATLFATMLRPETCGLSSSFLHFRRFRPSRVHGWIHQNWHPYLTCI